MNILQFNFLMLFIYGILFLNRFVKKRFGNIFLIFMTIQLSIISGFRSQWVGVDSNRYARHFENVSKMDSIKEMLNYNQEIGYVFFQKIVSFFSDKYYILFFISSLIIYTILAWFVKRYSLNYFLSYLIFISLGFFEFSMSGMRQSIAVSLGLIAFHYAVEKNLSKFLLICLLAITFHSSAIILVAFYPIVNLKLNNAKLLFISLLYLVTFTFRYQIGEFLTLFYYEDEASIILNRYGTSTGLGTMTVFMIALVILGFILKNPINAKQSDIYKGSFSTTIISIFFQTLSSFSYLFTRLNMFYMVLLIIYIPNLLDINPDNASKSISMTTFLKYLMILFIVVGLSVYYLIGINNNVSNLLPFKFFWE